MIRFFSFSYIAASHTAHVKKKKKKERKKERKKEQSERERERGVVERERLIDG